MYKDFLEHLSTKAVDHIAYYHYTRWGAFANMMCPVELPGSGSHRVLIMTRAGKSNDGLEERWPKNYFLSCFSLSRYEDVAMWLNYGKGHSDAVRIKITREAMDEWLVLQKTNAVVFSAGRVGDGFSYKTNLSAAVKSVKLYGVAYVVPSQHWFTAEDAVGDIQDCNVELGRRFYKVEKDGRFDWVDAIYGGEDLSKLGIPPVFKKRGWAYEREIRLVLELDPAKMSDVGEYVGIAFDRPLEQLESHMRMSQSVRESTFHIGEKTKRLKLWDRRVPMLQSGPWHCIDTDRPLVCGFSLDDAFKSEYVNEIRVFGNKFGGVK